ncbi:MAG TPA: energy transducer TonB [Candidatus Acidoferrales bacterium]|nr:energy transducer TonB [Candidatus Acidoferrales bacterium]
MISSAQVPLYPQVARIVNVEGVVHIRVTTDGHRVVSAQIKDGNKLLSASAEENIKSWYFSPHEPTTFTVTYTYKLVTDLQPVQNNPRVLLKLPTEVEVDALRWPGTVDMPGEGKQNPASPTMHRPT